MAGPLEGIRVVDATNFVMGPVATQMLGDMGADVIKVEPPEGDPTRKIGKSRTTGMGTLFLNLNRNKRSITLDLKTPEGSNALQSLLETADVFVHNMRSRAARQLGVDYETLHTKLPKLIYAAAQGFGRGGRYFDRPAYDDVIQGLSGNVQLHRMAGALTSYIPMLFTDKLCGIYLYSYITTALLHRERTGRGQFVSVPMFEVSTAFNLLEHLGDAALADASGVPENHLGYPRALAKAHRPIPTYDGFLCIVANTDAQWRRIFEIFGTPDLANDARFATIGDRMRNVDSLYALVGEQLRARPTEEWLDVFTGADIPVAPANDLEQVFRDPHLRDRNFFHSYSHPTEGTLLTTAVPVEFSDSPGSLRLGPPTLGEHTQEIQDELSQR